MKMNIDLINVKEASMLWELSVTTIKRKCFEGKIKSKKIAGVWVIFRDQNPPYDERRENHVR